MRKQKKIAWILAGLALALAVTLAIVIPLTRGGDEPDEPTVPPVATLDGEVVEGNYLLLYEHLRREDLSSITISNSYGEYTFRVNVADDGQTYFTLDGYSPVIAVEDSIMSQLVSVTGYTITSYYLDPETGESRYLVTTDPSDFARFGLSKEEEENLPFYRLETKDGRSYQVFIGDAIPSDGGYYVRVAGRDAVYIRSSSEVSNISVGYGATVLAPITSYVVPYLTVNGGYSLSYIYIKNFTLTHRTESGEQETFLMLDYLTTERRDMLNAAEVYAFTAPDSMTKYTPNSNAYMYVLELMQEWRGGATLEVGILDENGEFDMEKLKKYGLEDPAYYILFQMPWMSEDAIIDTVEEYRLFPLLISNRVGGSYYVASLMCDIVAQVPAADLDFLLWDKFDWIDPYLLPYNIRFVDAIRLSSAEGEYDFRLSHAGGDVSYVTEMISGTRLEDMDLFKDFYSILVSMDYEGDVNLTGEEIEALTKNNASSIATLTITLSDGRTSTYRFYGYSPQRCLVSLDGSCEFYTLSSMAKKMVRGAEALMRGDPIEWDERYQ